MNSFNLKFKCKANAHFYLLRSYNSTHLSRDYAFINLLNEVNLLFILTQINSENLFKKIKPVIIFLKFLVTMMWPVSSTNTQEMCDMFFNHLILVF